MSQEDNDIILYRYKGPTDKADDVAEISYNEKDKEYTVVLNGAVDDPDVQQAIFDRRIRDRIKNKNKPNYNKSKHSLVESNLSDKEKKKDMIKRLNRMKQLQATNMKKGRKSMRKKKNNRRVTTSRFKLRSLDSRMSTKPKKKETKRSKFSRFLEAINPITYIKKAVRKVHEFFTSKKVVRFMMRAKKKIMNFLKSTVLVPVLFIDKLLERNNKKYRKYA